MDCVLKTMLCIVFGCTAWSPTALEDSRALSVLADANQIGSGESVPGSEANSSFETTVLHESSVLDAFIDPTVVDYLGSPRERLHALIELASGRSLQSRHVRMQV